jgi:hypothetical protein
MDSNRQSTELGRVIPIDTHRATMTFRATKRLSPDRNVSVVAGGGATYSQTRPTELSEPHEYVAPAWQLGLHWNMSSRWRTSLDANRTVTVLEGFYAEPFNNDALVAVIDGQYSRVQVNGSVAYSHGDSASGRGAFEMKVANAQLGYTLRRCCAISAGYQYYDHHLFDLVTIQPGFPSRYERHSVRVGLHLWLPLYGSF